MNVTPEPALRELAAIEAHEARRSASIIADGFHDDPVCNWLFGKPDPIEPFFEMMCRRLYLPRGFGFRTSDDSGIVLWLAPNVSAKSDALTTARAIWMTWRAGGAAALGRAGTVDAALGDEKPSGHFYYLAVISVRRGAQGQGVGHDLLAPTLERIDREGADAYVESSNEKNLTFYQRHGFEIKGEVPLKPDGPSMFTLWRPGRAAAHPGLRGELT